MSSIIYDYLGVTPKEEANAKLVVGILSGVILGAAAGLLLAPQTGKETREDIIHAAELGKDKVKTGMDKAIDSASKHADLVKDSIKQATAELETKVKQALTKAEDSVELIEEVKEEVKEEIKKEVKAAKAELEDKAK